MLKNYSKIEVDEYGTKRYFNDEGKKHRLDGPAVECLNGTKHWFINGIDHRNIDSANEYSGRSNFWWFNGSQHRVGGSYNSEFKYWCIHGKRYTKQQYFDIVWNI